MELSTSVMQTDVGNPAPGSFRELSAHEFATRKELVVVLVKTGDAATRFQGYAGVEVVPACKAVEAYVARLPKDRPIGLVCPDGDCSSRMAIRLSRQGYRVYHLAGGLREWNQAFPGCATADA